MKQEWIVVDVESDGPAPGLYSMVSFAAVVVTPAADQYFFGRTAPISDRYVPEALAVSGVSRAEHLAFPEPIETMAAFAAWLRQRAGRRRLVFWSDNVAFDWQWINYYLHRYAEDNPFGHSGRRIGDLYAGLQGRPLSTTEWKKLRRTAHSHNPLDDARGNVEALIALLPPGFFEKELA